MKTPGNKEEFLEIIKRLDARAAELGAVSGVHELAKARALLVRECEQAVFQLFWPGFGAQPTVYVESIKGKWKSLEQERARLAARQTPIPSPVTTRRVAPALATLTVVAMLGLTVFADDPLAAAVNSQWARQLAWVTVAVVVLTFLLPWLTRWLAIRLSRLRNGFRAWRLGVRASRLQGKIDEELVRWSRWEEVREHLECRAMAVFDYHHEKGRKAATVAHFGLNEKPRP